ncbi:hypothetical protein [Desulfonema ishimotonii]|uniref:hypothetical protein n=1 Tax=Desulfonema ishimotonii TaxID=45657 RepID=UPI000F57C499|nr:hypothetical protein [Desulfonema ishimotonii]
MTEQVQMPSDSGPDDELLEKSVPEYGESSDEEAVAYEEVTIPDLAIHVPEIPEIASGDDDTGPNNYQESESEDGETDMPETMVADIPDIPEEDSWSEIVYEEGGPPPGV